MFKQILSVCALSSLALLSACGGRGCNSCKSTCNDTVIHERTVEAAPCAPGMYPEDDAKF